MRLPAASASVQFSQTIFQSQVYDIRIRWKFLSEYFLLRFQPEEHLFLAQAAPLSLF